MRKKTWTIATLISVALHGAVLILVLWWAVRERAHVRAVPLAVQLVPRPAAERVAAPEPPAVSLAHAAGPGTSRRREPIETANELPPVHPPVALQAPPGPTARRGTTSTRLGEWWSGRSMGEYVRECRGGDAPQDSVLNPAPTPQQIALARTTQQLNLAVRRLYGTWMLEKFEESLKENFPLMR